MLCKTRKKMLFLILYGFAALSKMQANLNEPYWDNAIPYVIYCLLLTVGCVFDIIKAKKLIISTYTKSFLWIITYVLLWSTIFANPEYGDLITDNCIQMIFFILFMGTTAYYVNKFDCLKEMLLVSYCIQLSFIIFCFFSFNSGGNWMINLATFFEGGAKQKIGYGGNANIMGGLCFLTSAIGLLLCEFVKRKKYIFIFNFFVAYILLTTSARIAIICTAFYYSILLVYQFYKKRPSLFLWLMKRSWVLAVILLFFVVLNPDKFSSLLFSMNRYYTVKYNLMALSSSGRWLIGNGYINYGLMTNFLARYGIPLVFSESWYIDVIVTTGVLGLFWMVFYFYMFVKSIIKSDYLTDNIKMIKILLMFICFILYGAVEPVGFASAYWISFCVMTIGCAVAIRKGRPKQKFD